MTLFKTGHNPTFLSSAETFRYAGNPNKMQILIYDLCL
jgi:hypothetical protein